MRKIIASFGSIRSAARATAAKSGSQAAHEVEAKFSSRGPINMSGIFSIAGFRPQPQIVKPQNDTYYDTLTLILFRESLGTLRLRESGGKHKVTLKWSVGKTGATLTRTETEEAVTEQAARDILNHRLFNEARGVLNTAELLPVLAVENKRTIIDFRLGDSCIELSLDAMHFRVADAGVHTFRRQQAGPFFEVEAENKGASEKEFGLFIRALVCNFTLTPSSDVKYERGVKALGLVEG